MIPRIVAHTSPSGEYIHVDPCNLLPGEIGEFMARLESAKIQCSVYELERRAKQFPDRTGYGWIGSDTTQRNA